MPVALISTSTSPACGPSRSTSAMVSGSPAFQAMAAFVFMGLLRDTASKWNNTGILGRQRAASRKFHENRDERRRPYPEHSLSIACQAPVAVRPEFGEDSA